MIIVSIRDSAVKTFAPPMIFPTREAAIRIFIKEVNRESDDNLLFHNRADFDLYELGNFDDVSGSLTSHPEIICHGRDVSRPQVAV